MAAACGWGATLYSGLAAGSGALGRRTTWDGPRPWQREQLPEEAKLLPREGDRVRVGDKEFRWKSHRGDEPVLDFNRFVGQVTNHASPTRSAT